MRRHRGLIIGLVLGTPLMAIGIFNIAVHTHGVELSSFVEYFAGSDLVSDFFVLPIAALVGFVVVRHAPVTLRPALRAALFGSAVVIAIAWPGLHGYGRHQAPDNSSVEPLNYTTAVATVLLVVWALAIAWSIVSVVRAHRHGRGFTSRSACGAPLRSPPPGP